MCGNEHESEQYMLVLAPMLVVLFAFVVLAAVGCQP
jgi:hypothetical protein